MPKTIRVAAAGDIHAGSGERDRVREAFRRVESQADLVLLAGDLTQHGQVDEVCVVADACRDLDIPVVAVLGNHDWQSDRPADLVRALGRPASPCSTGRTRSCRSAASSVGIAGVKGFVGGFGNQLGELRRADLPRGVRRDDEGRRRARTGLAAIGRARCGSRFSTTRRWRRRSCGEPERLWLVLGADRLAGPIRAHRPHLVVHGHAHHGSFEGDVDGVPVLQRRRPRDGPRSSGCSSSTPRTQLAAGRSPSRRPSGRVRAQEPTTLQSQRRGRERSSSMKRTRCHCAEAELGVADGDRLAGRAEDHRHAVRVAVADLLVLLADVLGAPVPVVVGVVGLVGDQPAKQRPEVLEHSALVLVDPDAAGRVRRVDAADPVDDAGCATISATSSVMSVTWSPPVVRKCRSAWKTFIGEESNARPSSKRTSALPGP